MMSHFLMNDDHCCSTENSLLIRESSVNPLLSESSIKNEKIESTLEIEETYPFLLIGGNEDLSTNVIKDENAENVIKEEFVEPTKFYDAEESKQMLQTFDSNRLLNIQMKQVSECNFILFNSIITYFSL